MINLPPDFDVTALVSDFTDLAAPFVVAASLITVGFIIIRIIKRAP